MGKLLQNSKYEISNKRHRQTLKDENKSNNMETMEKNNPKRKSFNKIRS